MTGQENLSEFEQGRRAAHLNLLVESLRHLGYEATEAKLAALVEERERALMELRSIYDKWPQNLDLGDAIKIVFEQFEKELIEDFNREMADARSSEL